MYPHFINADFFVKWNFEFEKMYKFDPEDASLPWFMLEGTDLYSEDDWLEFDFEPFLNTFLRAHEKSANISLELSGAAYDKILAPYCKKDDIQSGLTYYRIQQVTLNKHHALTLMYIKAIHWLLKRKEPNVYGDGYVAHFVEKVDLKEGGTFFFAELRMSEEEKVSLNISLVTDQMDYYSHGVALPDSLRKNWLEEFKDIKACIDEECSSRIQCAKKVVDTHKEAAEELIVWLKRNVHTLPFHHAKLFSADLGFLTSVIESSKTSVLERSNRNMYAWYKMLKMFGRYASLETVSKPIDFDMAIVFRASPVKRKRQTYGPFNLQCDEEWQVFLQAVSMLFHQTVYDSLFSHLRTEPFEAPNLDLARGLRFLHSVADKNFTEKEDGDSTENIRFSLDDRFIELLTSDSLPVKQELRYFFQYLDHHRITPRWCYEAISKERSDKGPPFQPQDDIADCVKKAMENNKMSKWVA